MEREERITEMRLKQPLEELERKARKAVMRSQIWSQEELDFARARGRQLAESLAALCCDAEITTL